MKSPSQIPMPLVENHAIMQSVSDSAQSTPGIDSSSAGKPVFTNLQIEVLKGQIAAFKLLSSNMPLPFNLQQLIFGQDQTPYGVVSKIVALSAQAASKQEQSSFTLPFPIPSISPVLLREQRERILLARRDLKIKKLQSLPANLPDEAKLRATVELKALNLYEFQQSLRQSIIQNYTKMTEIESVTDPASFIRSKQMTLTETRLTQKLERQQRFDVPRVTPSAAPFQTSASSNAKYSETSIAFVNGWKEFTNFHRTFQNHFQTKVVRAVVNFHVNFEKEEQKRMERLAKDRLKALKADDEEAYFKLIDQEKDTRLTQILGQTDSYLDSLKKRVMEQRNESVPVGEGTHSVEDSNDYYSVVHFVKEVVEKQPSLLVGGQLKDYQIKGLQWMLSLYNNKLNGILADEMGLGKTIQTISLISYLIEFKGQSGPFLVVVPLSTLSNWSLEFQKWAPSLQRIEYKGSPQQRKSAQAQVRMGRFNVLLTTYEYIIKDRYFLSKLKWLYLIVDEGHRMKNAQSKLSTILSQHYSTRYRLILTGTPLQNNLPELWSLLNFVLPKIFNSSKTFDDWFNAPFANTGEKIELNEEEQLLLIRRLHKVLRPFLLRRLKKDVESELPDKIETVIKCPMSALQESLYRMVQKSSRKTIHDAASSTQVTTGIRRLNNTIMQLRKICNHPFVFEEVEQAINPLKHNNDLLFRTCGKFELLSRLLPKLKATNHRVLIFFQMTHIMTIMEDFLHMLGYQYLRLDGSTKSEERSELLAKFNDPSSPYFVFLLSTRAGGLGLNLQSADTVIIYDSDWNPHQDLQAQDRAHRIGQTKEVRILRLVTVNSVEEYILERARFKLNIDIKVIQAGKFDQKSTSEERDAMLRALLTENSSTNTPTEDEENNAAYSNEEVNEMIARNDEELVTFSAIDQQIEESFNSFYQSQAKQPPSRLISQSELPHVYLLDLEKEKERELQSEQLEAISRKRKSRSSISVLDEMSDEEWLEKLEAEDQDESPVQKRKKVPMYPPYPVSLPSPHHLMQWLETVCSIDQSRLLITPFLHLPSSQEYPDYYRIISNPISYDQIKQILADSSGNWKSQWSDMLQLMFSNAMQYNAKGSQIWLDAEYLLGILPYLSD